MAAYAGLDRQVVTPNKECDIHTRINASAFDPRQEPGAVVPLAGICAGGTG